MSAKIFLSEMYVSNIRNTLSINVNNVSIDDKDVDDKDGVISRQCHH